MTAAPIRFVRVYIGVEGRTADLEAEVGAGWRCLLLFNPGRTKVTAVYPWTLAARRVSRAVYEPAEDVPMTPRRWQRLAARLDELRRTMAADKKTLRRRTDTGKAATLKSAAALCRQIASKGRTPS